MHDKENILYVNLISWDEKEISMIFSNPIQFSYKLGNTVSEFYEILEDSPFLLEALSHQYEKPPKIHPFKLFQIWDIDDFPFISVVSESVNVIKGNQIVGF